ncbi:hypothetical protein A9179_08735 [Pseudomonas alcaligenes]|uniref:Solute-binding protein family 3/N-terminal domain-containing protein n=1 Tax=Aquipseudomonas alcaligenes TaxID=43263 RepID=A0ABR7RZZ8_AQUAC|nr:hypothetical protein [Pseudomonas alcaligenes]MBC9250354.1 hypothetical protein [Pseudomonas alcaligenes]
MPNLRLALLSLTAVLAAPAFAEPVLRLCHELDGLPPYINTLEADRDLPQPGLVLELIQRAATQARIQVETHRQPWLRCIHELQEGSSDGAFVAVWQLGREAWGHFPGGAGPQAAVDPRYRLWHVDYPIIVRKGSALRWDGQHFSGVTYQLSSPPGYVARQHLKEQGVLSTLSLTPAKALALVARGRLDGYVLERHVGQHLIDRLQLGEQLTLLPQPLFEDDWYLPLSHQFYQRNPEVAERFWQALASERERLQGELTQRYLSGGADAVADH